MTRQQPPFTVGQRVTWTLDDGRRIAGIVVSVEWKRTGFWSVSATVNGQPWHPVTNRVECRTASASKFQESK